MNPSPSLDLEGQWKMGTPAMEPNLSDKISALPVEHAVRRVPTDEGAGGAILPLITDPLVRQGQPTDLAEINRVEHLDEVKRQRLRWQDPNRVPSRFDKPSGEPSFEYSALVEDLRRTQTNIERLRDAIESEDANLEALESQEEVKKGTAVAMSRSVANIGLFRREIGRMEEYARELQWWLQQHIDWQQATRSA